MHVISYNKQKLATYDAGILGYWTVPMRQLLNVANVTHK